MPMRRHSALLTTLAGGLVGELVASSAVFALQNTASTNDMGPDGYSWPQSGRRGPIVVDAFGRLIAIAEDAGGNHALVYSNDGGATWAESLSLGFLTRGAIDYNATLDRLEVCWNAQAATDGILYRAYTIARTGGAITSFAAAGSGYCILDAQTTGTMHYEHPCILWLSDLNAVVCAWGARNTGTGGTGNEIRCAMRILTGVAASDQNPANWTHVGVNSTTTIGNAPGAATYTALLANATTGVPHPALIRLASSDLFLAYHDGTVTGGVMAGNWGFRRATWNGTNWPTLGSATVISALKRAGTDTGYLSKGELLTKIAQDGAANVYVSLATWKDNANGDTWGFAQITPADVVTLVDVYSVGGAHSYAPTGDLDYDAASGRIVTSYIKTTTQAAYARVYSGASAAQAEVLLFSTAPVDIPLIRTDALSGRLSVLFRDTNTPRKGWFGTLVWR